MELLFVLAIALAQPLIGFLIGKQRERALAGFLYGLFLGPLGWLLVCLGDGRPICRACRSRVPSGATVCRHCHSSLVAPPDKRQQCPYCYQRIDDDAPRCPSCLNRLAWLEGEPLTREQLSEVARGPAKKVTSLR